MRAVLRGKIHRAIVTDANLNYEGSVTLDPMLMAAADIVAFEQVHVLDVNNGNRLTTYAIAGAPGSGEVCINGAAAHLVSPGDSVIILAYSTVPEEEARRVAPRLVYVDENNRVLRTAHEIASVAPAPVGG